MRQQPKTARDRIGVTNSNEWNKKPQRVQRIQQVRAHKLAGECLQGIEFADKFVGGHKA